MSAQTYKHLPLIAMGNKDCITITFPNGGRVIYRNGSLCEVHYSNGEWIRIDPDKGEVVDVYVQEAK